LRGRPRFISDRSPENPHLGSGEGLETGADRLHAKVVARRSLRPAQVARQHQRRTLVSQLADRRERGGDPEVVGDLSGFEGNVQVQPNERSPPREVAEVGDRPQSRRGGIGQSLR
jgi:hypothetical protein